MDIPALAKEARDYLKKIKETHRKSKVIRVDCGEVKYNVHFVWSYRYKTYINSAMHCLVLLGNTEANLRKAIATRRKKNDLQQILGKHVHFRNFIKGILGKNWVAKRKWLEYLVNTGPTPEKPGWVYVYCRLQDVVRQRETKQNQGKHVILHKVGLTRRRNPVERINEQEAANEEQYIMGPTVYLRVPAWFEKLVHLYFGDKRVNMRGFNGNLLSGGTEWFLVGKQEVSLDILKILGIARYVWGNLI